MSRNRNIADLGGQSLATDAEVASAVASKASYVYSSTAPSSPSNGFLWMDTSTASPKGKVWNGSEWKLFSGAGAANFSNTATGTYTSGGENYKYVRFVSNGTLVVTQQGTAEILVVAGGSSGGGEYNVAGRGGGISYGTVLLEVGNHPVVIGAGGCCGGATNSAQGGNIGGDSRLGNFAAARATGWNSGGFNAPYVSSITGSSITYGATGGAAANTGSGGTNAGCCGAPPGQNGAAGVVVIRVTV